MEARGAPTGCIAGQISCSQRKLLLLLLRCLFKNALAQPGSATNVSHYISELLLLKPTLPYRDAHPTFMGLIEGRSEIKQVADILDRIIDKGTVIDARTRLFLMDMKIKSSGTRVQAARLDSPSRDEPWSWNEAQRKRRAA